MAGHSKWSKIKRDKAANDSKKGALFTKLGHQIAVAAREGVNVATNPALAAAIETAKSFNMPQSTIDRALKRAADKALKPLETVLYEAYGQGGTALLIEAATDNRKRTFPEIKAALSKNGGSLAETGSVVYNFKHAGEIIVKAQGDKAILDLLDQGAVDVLEEENFLRAICPVKIFHQVLQGIKDRYPVEQAHLCYLAQNSLVLAADKEKKVTKLIEALEDLEDVLQVYTNLK